MTLSTPKGMPDYLPEQQIIIEDVKKIVKEIFEKYGFVPVDTPAIENLEILNSKGGSEIGKEIFSLEDRAGRKLGLRFDFTVPLARIFASNPNLNQPFKRYQEGKVWRQEFGNRTREFTQFDADIIGSSSLISDAEIIACYQEIFDRLGLPVIIKVNNRNLLSEIIEKCGAKKNQVMDIIMIVDKLAKIGEKKVIEEAESKSISDSLIKKILKTLSEKTDSFKKYNSYSDIEEVINYSKLLGARDIFFAPNLARGLDYYTGIVFEVYLKERPDKLSLAGGGRYDNLISQLSGKKEQTPAVGGSVGITRIYDVLSKVSKKNSLTKLYIIPLNTEKESLKIATQMRRKGINVETDLMSRSLSGNFKYADKMKIPYAVVVGEKEIKSNKFNLKDMKTGKQESLSIAEISKLLE